MYSLLPRSAMRRVLSLVALAAILLTAVPLEALASLDLVSGQTAVISDANGDPVNLRAKPRTSSEILASLPEGTRVEILEGPIADGGGSWWYKVVAAGTRGYMAAEFLSLADGGTSSDGNPVGVVTGTGTIFNTNGDPINCRSGASVEYGVIGEFFEGDSVEFTGEAIGAWQPVNCGEQGGYVHTDYIAYPGTSPEPDASAEATTARVVNTGGDPINCRARASTSSTVLTVFHEGDRVTLAGNLVNSWQPVKCAGTTGYMHRDYLSTTNGDDGGDDNSGVTGKGVVVDTNGDGLRCRDRASYDSNTITVLKEGARVDLRGSVKSGWQPVFCAGMKGYAKAEFIDIADDRVPDDDQDENRTGFSEGDAVVVANTNGEGVRLRSKASTSSSIIAVLPEGTEAVVRMGSTGDWVAVIYRTSNGFIHKDYLTLDSGGDDGGDDGSRGDLGRGDHAELTDLMNFRSGPSLSASIISTVPKGTVVLISGSASGGFYPVKIAGFDGYLHGDFLKWTDKPLTEDDNDGVGGDPGDGPATPQGTKMITYAMKYLGYPYVWATHGPDSFDCSGFTYWVTIKTLKKDIGAGTWSQSVSGRPVAYGELRPGDLVFFQNTFTWGLSHVGIYIGDGKFIHAENESTGVVVSDLTSPYYSSRWYGARRITTD